MIDEDEVEYEDVPPFLWHGLVVGLLALLVDDPLFAIIAVFMLVYCFYVEWNEGRFDWNFGLDEGVTNEVR